MTILVYKNTIAVQKRSKKGEKKKINLLLRFSRKSLCYWDERLKRHYEQIYEREIAILHFFLSISVFICTFITQCIYRSIYFKPGDLDVVFYKYSSKLCFVQS